MNGKSKGSHKDNHSRGYWIQSVQNRPNSAGRLTGAAKFTASVARGDSHEYFSTILRRNIGPPGTGTGTLAPPTARPDEVPFLSTSMYLRDQFGVGALQSPSRQSDSKLPPGTPYYKTPEEYYDEVLELRKQIAEVLGENSVLKAKQRRLEDELGKKDRELINIFEKNLEKGDTVKLMDQPTGRGDKNTIVHNLKLRLFKLEQKYKSKDTECKRMEADIRKTDADELRRQLDICLEQISTLRYHNAKILSGQVSERSAEVTQVITKKTVDRADMSSDETDSFTSDSETGYNGRRSRSASHSRNASLSRLAHQRPANDVHVKNAPVVATPKPEERPQSSDRPKCTIKEHQRLEDVAIELEKALEELERRRQHLAKSDSPVRVHQKKEIKGRPADRLLALDDRETELLIKLNALAKENEELRENLKLAESEVVKHREKPEGDNVSELQAILRAHQLRMTRKDEAIMESSRHSTVDEFPPGDTDAPAISELQSIIRAHLERATFEANNSHILEE